MRARGDLALQARDLRIHVFRVRVEGAADDELRGGFDRLAGVVVALVQPLDDADELDGADIVHRRRAGVVADFRRVAGERQHVVDLQGGHAHQLALQADQIAVAAAQVQQRVDVMPLLEHGADGEIAHAQDGQGIIRERNEVAARLGQRLGARRNICPGRVSWAGRAPS